MVSDAQKRRERQLNRIAIAVSVVVFVVVGMMRRVHLHTGFDFSFLPAVNATINSITFILLLAALRQIKRKNIAAHRKLMTGAVVLSVLFLTLYVLYHLTTPETKYGGTGVLKTVYLLLLATHVVLAGVVLPFILFTYIRAITGQYDRHKKLARWVFPVWLYVALTGPVIYWMLRPYY